MAKTAQNTADSLSRDALPSGSGSATDPDFNDALPGVGDTPAIDPEAAEFRDELQVGSYAAVGALQTEMDRERQEAESATLEALEAMRAMDAGDQVKWRISRSGHENDELNGYLETWPNHQMTIERLRDRFGGGTFYCKGFRKGRYMAHQVLQVSGEAKRKPSGVEGVNQSVPVNAAPAFDVQSFMAQQERRDQQRRDEERRERQEREERDEKRRAERMQLLLTLGPAAITALGGLFGGRQDNTAALITALKPPDPLTMLTQLKALNSNNDQAGMMKILPMLLEMATSKSAAGDTGWLDVIKEFAKSAGPTIGGMIEMSVQQARQNAQQQLPAPAPENPTAAAPAISPGDSSPLIVMPEARQPRGRRFVNGTSTVAIPGQQSMTGNGNATTAGAGLQPATPGGGDVNIMKLFPHLPWLRDQLVRLGKAAVANRNPQVYAALFVEELPESIDVNLVGELLSADDWYAKLIQLEPRLDREDFLPWFTELRNQVIRLLQGSESVTDATGSVLPSATPAPAPAAGSSQKTFQAPTKVPSLDGKE